MFKTHISSFFLFFVFFTAVLDAVGKPTAGIKKGVLYFIGNYDQCMSTTARIHISVNASVEDPQNNHDISFNGRYCRSTFSLPQSLVNSVAGEHANVSKL